MKKIPLDQKSTTEEIRKKFDQLAESYSDIETGQSTAIDSPWCIKGYGYWLWRRKLYGEIGEPIAKCGLHFG